MSSLGRSQILIEVHTFANDMDEQQFTAHRCNGAERRTMRVADYVRLMKRQGYHIEIIADAELRSAIQERMILRSSRPWLRQARASA